MLIKILLLFFISISLNATTIIQNSYYVKNNDINLSTIVKNVKQDVLLFKIHSNRYSKQVKSTLLIKLLKEHGYSDYKAKGNYITFKKKSPINLSKIKKSIEKYYKEKYSIINIQKVEVQPRGYITSLPKNFTVHLRKRNFLSKNGVANIRTIKNKQLFFDYTITAKLPVYITRKKLKKDTELSALNTQKKSIILDKFRAKPIQKITKNTLQTKHQIKQNKILTSRNVEELNVIKRGSTVRIILHGMGMDISFEAKAIRDAKIGETITVRSNNNKILKVKAIGKNRAEMW